ncbi:MAG TPA: alpha/beta fold hydrolase [Actinomycetota bacterium]
MAWLSRPDGCRLFFEVHGDPKRRPLVLLEGMGGDLSGWRRNIPHLAAELFVVGYDFRGNGRSDAPDGPVTMSTFVDDTIALLDELRIERAHLYGQSFGGMVAQELVLRHPQRVGALVLACTHAGGGHVVRTRAKVPKDRPYLALYAPRFAAEHLEHVLEDLRVGARNPQAPHAGKRQWEAVQGFDAHDRLPEIMAPTLVLHGSEDMMIDPENARVLASRIPGAELRLLEGAGHLYHSEQAERADEIVLDFLRRHHDA